MLSRKAQAGAAAGLIAVIALLIVFYILLLPEQARTELLNGTTSTTSKSSSTKEARYLVFEHPGTLDPARNQDREKVLDSFSLYTEKSALILESVPSVHIENGWLTEKIYNLTFKIDDFENTDNHVLAFDVAKGYGRIMIFLNGKQIYDSEIATGNAEPIVLSKDLIHEENSLVFKSAGVGLAFWKLNEYDLKNLKVVADFTDVSKREYKNFFIISATEKENFETTKLTFVPDCLTPGLVGPISIDINGNELHYSAVPDCGTLSKIEFDPNYLKQGENYITFRAESGSYFIDRVAIKAELKKMTYPFYYFELDEEDMGDIRNESLNITLELKFADKEDKIGELNVNGHLSRIETDNSTFRKVINTYVEENQNYLQIRPITTINIVDLIVSKED